MKGTLRLFLTLCIAMLSMTLVQAQEKTYSGTVKSGDDGQVIIGANVVVDGTTKGTSTGVDGKFTISAKAGEKLAISYLGMKSQVVTLGATTTVNITLQSDAEAMDEVVVIAFGTTKKKDLTGSMSTIDSKLIGSQSNSTVSKALEGSVPGVQLSSQEGQPGEDAKIQIRGLGTANPAQAGALIVIDGVPSTNANVLSMLNPKDIASMTISKDATSNALYGSRGANGVVLITTKKGTLGKAKVTFEGRWGMNMMGSKGYDLINDNGNPASTYEYAWQSIYNAARYQSNLKNQTNVNNPNMTHDQAAEFASQHLFDYNGTVGSNYGRNGLGNYMAYSVPGATYTSTGNSATMTGDYLVGLDGKLNPNAKLLYADDWYDEFFQARFRQEYNVSVSGATEKTDYYISVGYLDDPAFFASSSFQRYNARVNVNSQINKWLKAGMNMSYTRRFREQPPTRFGFNPGSSSENMFYWAFGGNALKTIWARDEQGNIKKGANGEKLWDMGTGMPADGTYSPLGVTNRGSSGRNPGHFLEKDKWQRTIDDITGRGYVEAKFLKDFKFTANLNLDNSAQMTHRYANKVSAPANGAAVQGAMGETWENYLSINSQQILDWSHDFGKHHVDAMIGHEYLWTETRNMSSRAYMSLIDDKDSWGNFVGWNDGTVPMSGLGGDKNLYALEGYFARANYIFDNKYYVSASIRTDGSSKFKAADKRWGTFWTVGGAWRISSENFLQNASWLNDLKIRASYGTMGNENGVGQYAGYTLWNLSNSTSNSFSGAAINIGFGGLGNPDLSWELVKTFDAGIDFRMWDRFYGSLDYYLRNTTDMIWNKPTAPTSGLTSLLENSASMRNFGVEWDLGVDIIRTDDILWSFNVNGTHYRNKLTSIPAGVGSERLGGNFEANNPAGNAVSYLRGVGKDFYNMYLFKYAGVDKESGLAMYMHRVTEDDHQNGYFTDKEIGTSFATTNYEIASRYEMGSATPDVIGGFGTSFRYKNFDFGATFAFQIGGKFLSKEYGDNLYAGVNSIGGFIPTDFAINKRWSPSNPNGNMPIQMAGLSGSNAGATVGSWLYTDMCVFDASYLSVKNITLGYNLPQQLMDKWGIGGIRVYASADNMWLITSKSGFDPRMDLSGGMNVGAYIYPQMRTMSLGVNITF